MNINGGTNDINGLYNIKINAIESTHFVLYYHNIKVKMKMKLIIFLMVKLKNNLLF